MTFSIPDICFYNFSENDIGLPKILKVMSLVAPVEKLHTSEVTSDVTVSSVPAVCTPQAPENILEDREVAGGPLTTVRNLAAQLEAATQPEGVREGVGEEVEEEGEGGANEEARKEGGVDPTLMSLLNEIVFLNQQLSGDGSKPCTPSHVTPPEPGEVLADRPASLDEERSPSPLFLRLDCDTDTSTPTSTPAKPTTTDASETPVGESVTESPVTALPVSGSTLNLTPAPLLSSATNGQGQLTGAGGAKGDGLTPPPLLQMKAGHVAPPVMPSVTDNLSWRPMPKLVPLGLKGTPQTPANRGTGSTP